MHIFLMYVTPVLFLCLFLFFCFLPGRHKLQKHSPRFQEVSWQGIFRSLRAAPQKQFGLRHHTNAHRNDWHQGERGATITLLDICSAQWTS